MEKSYKCYICENKYPWKSDLKKHLLTHAEDREVLSCPHCTGFKTHSKKLLAQHLSRHDTEKQFKCSCGKMYKFMSSFLGHKKTCDIWIKENEITQKEHKEHEKILKELLAGKRKASSPLPAPGIPKSREAALRKETREKAHAQKERRVEDKKKRKGKNKTQVDVLWRSCVQEEKAMHQYLVP